MSSLTAPAITRRGPATADSRPRVVQVIPTLRTGGLENVVVRLVTHFESILSQGVVTPAKTGPLASRFPAGVSIVAMGDRHRPDRFNALRMARVFRALRPDIVHTRNWTCIDAILGARLAGVPHVIHGEHGREAADPTGANRLRRRVRRALAPLVSQFVTVSRDLNRWLVEDVRVPARKVRTIYNGVDTDRFAPGDREAARRALDIPSGWGVVGTVGRLDPVKDQAGLIRAFAVASAQRPSVLLIVGDGPLRAELDALGRGLGLDDRLRLLGDRQDVAQILRALDCFVLPSVGEGISNAILEAMATALPVVATRVGGNVELVEDGETGLLVEVGQPEGLVRALECYLGDSGIARKHGAAARVRVEREFGLARMLTGYGDLYRSLVGGLR
jgi:sugar transferase (PEP-CTERM/EpsH1 system associated)